MFEYLRLLMIVFIFPFLIMSCQRKQNKVRGTILTFDLSELPKPSNVKLSDLGFIDIEYIPLETNEQSLISGIDNIFFNEYNINKIIAGKDYYLIKNGKRILKFRNDGSLISSIGRVGRGPNEFTNIEDLDIDKENQDIYILSGWQKKMCVYSKSGEFKKTFDIPNSGLSEFRFTDNNILFYNVNIQGNIENSFDLLNINGEIIKSFSNKYPFNKIKNNASGSAHENLFYRFNNLLFKKEIYSDTVYVFNNLDFIPHFIIDTGERLITSKARSEFDALYIGENFIDPLNLFEFGDYVFYAFIYKFVLPDDVLIYGFIGSKNNDYQALINLGQGFINDLDGGPNIIPITTKDDNTLITIIDALKIKSHVSSEAFKNSSPKYPEKKNELEKLAASLKETDNPVLVLVRLKE